MVWTRGLTPELYEKVSAKLVFQEFTQSPQRYPEVFNVDTTDMAFIDSFSVAGFGRFSLKPEGTAVVFDDPVQGDRKREIVLTYALGFRWTMEAQEDEQYGMLGKFTADQGASARDSQDRLAFGLINDGPTGALYTGNPEGDGTRRALWSTAHVPLKNVGAVQSNRLNPGMALSEPAIEAAVLIFRRTQSEEERFVENRPTTLLIAEENEFTAHKLLESQQVVGSADNDVNYVNKLGLKVVRVPYITDTDSFSVWGAKHFVFWTNRKKLTVTSASDSLTGDKMTLSHYRCAVHFSSWRGSVASIP